MVSYLGRRVGRLMTLLCLIDLTNGRLPDNASAARLPGPFNAIAALQQPPDRPLDAGGQDFVQCCLRGVRDSYDYNSEDGTIEQTVDATKRFLNLSPVDLNSSQFPCGAVYQSGNNDGAPDVTVPYLWCMENCEGWQVSRFDVLTQWVQPFVGYILPAAIFCVAVPHGTFLDIPSWNSDFLARTQRVPFLYFFFTLVKWLAQLLPTALWALLKTATWIALLFSTAGPMILSGLYEATLDREVIEHILNDAFVLRNPRRRRHLLYAVLVGNLAEGRRDPWRDVDALVDDFDNPQLTKIRLKAMLNCQAPFGVTVVGSVAIFLGSFLFNVFSALSTLGDNDTSHAIAFGQWWMTVIHVAVLSGCLLAGNNPSTLELAISGLHGGPQQTQPLNPLQALQYHPEPAYTAVWMWSRGRSKRNWIRRVLEEPQNRTAGGVNTETETYFDLQGWDWLLPLVLLTLLLGVPCLLAILTSVYTPFVGLSCRSMTVLVYLSSQIWLCLCWAFNFWYADVELDAGRTFLAFLKRHEEIVAWTFKILVVVLGLFPSLFTTVAGTIMQLVGVYRTCFCIVPIQWWLKTHEFTGIVISQNSKDAIRYARTFWLGTGYASIAILVTVVYLGWKYQRYRRAQFTTLIDLL